MDIANNLRHLREAAGLSQTEVAAELHITRQAYNHYETGKRLPTLEALSLLAGIFDSDLSSLLGQECQRFSLSDEERELVEAYRKLSERQQLIIRGRVFEYLEIDENKKRRRNST